jgi:hypothetical protein
MKEKEGSNRLKISLLLGLLMRKLAKKINIDTIILLFVIILCSCLLVMIAVEIHLDSKIPSSSTPFSFQIGEKVVSKIDPLKIEGIVINRKCACDIKQSIPQKYTPCYYEVRFPVPYEGTTLFRTELLTETELEKCSDFINSKDQ